MFEVLRTAFRRSFPICVVGGHFNAVIGQALGLYPVVELSLHSTTL